VDSTIVRAQIQRESYGFGTFVATRIAEIQNKTESSEWWWVPTDKNAADLTTRITSPHDLEFHMAKRTAVFEIPDRKLAN
jgi:hypothetical protein